MSRRGSTDRVQRTVLTMDVEDLESDEQERQYGNPNRNAVHELTVEGRASHLVIIRPGEDVPFYSCVPAEYDGEETRFEWSQEVFDHLDEGGTESVQIEVFSVAR